MAYLLRQITAACEKPGSVLNVVEGGGFEPPKAEPTDLQSVPFDRLGIPPQSSRALLGIAVQLSTVVTGDDMFPYPYDGGTET